MVAVIENGIKEVVEKFSEIERELAAEKGEFNLFALFEREDSPGRWDVVISASWIGQEEKEAVKIIVGKITEKLTTLKERIMLSRIIVLPPNDQLVKNFNILFQAEHSLLRTTNININDVSIKDAFIISSRSS